MIIKTSEKTKQNTSTAVITKPIMNMNYNKTYSSISMSNEHATPSSDSEMAHPATSVLLPSYRRLYSTTCASFTVLTDRLLSTDGNQRKGGGGGRPRYIYFIGVSATGDRGTNGRLTQNQYLSHQALNSKPTHIYRATVSIGSIFLLHYQVRVWKSDDQRFYTLG